MNATLRPTVPDADEIPHMVWAAGPDGDAVYHNRRCLEYLGIAPDELRRAGWGPGVHPDDLSAANAAWDSALRTGEPLEIESRLRRYDGAYRWHAVVAHPQRDENGRVVRWVGTCTDIEGTKRAAEAVRAGEARYRELFESNPHPMWVYDTETLRFLAVNDAAVDRYGYSREEFLTLSAADIRPPEDVEPFREDVKRAVSGLQCRGLWRHRWKDGTLRDVEVAAHSLRFADRPARLVLALDVTDRLRAEVATERGLARLRAVGEGKADGVIIAGPSGDLLEWNPAALRMLGYATLEEARRPLSALASVYEVSQPGLGPIAPEDWPMARVLRGETLTGYELHVRRPDLDLELFISFSGAPVLGPDGAVELGVLALHDVTDRRRAEAEVRRSGELLKAVADGTTDAVFVKDLRGRYLLCNPATAQFMGRSVEEVLGRDDAELFDAAGARVIAERDRRVTETGQVQSGEETLTADGVTRTYLVTKAPYRDSQGAIAGVVGISRDITARRQLEAERDALLARLQLQIERMPLAYVLFDANLRVTDWNQTAERTFGFTRSEMLEMGAPLDRLIPGALRAEAEKLFNRIRSGDMTAHSVNENLTKDGRTITCEWYNTPLFGEAGEFVGLVSLVQDVTRRKLLEDQYRQAQKMEAIGRLAGGVAHDFNNLLTVICGCSEMILADLPREDPNRALVKEVYKAGERAALLTRQLLTFSRKAVVEPEVLDLSAVVEGTCQMLHRLIGEDVRLATGLSPALDRVRADAGQVEQVVMNLAVNARDAMPTGGRLTIETANVQLDEAYARTRPGVKPGRYVLLAVSDTGCGMTDEVRGKIFEPFFTTKEAGKGTGLGLATVFGIMQQSGGHVEVESEVGRGTTFNVYFPSAGRPSLSATTDSGFRAVSSGRERVLIVEDDDRVRGLTRLALRTQGYEVLEAASGDEAVLVCESHPGAIDRVVTDVVMPGMSGRQVAEAAVRLRPGVRVLYVSGYTDDAVVRHGVAGGAAFLQKPFTPAVLGRKVREVLDAG